MVCIHVQLNGCIEIKMWIYANIFHARKKLASSFQFNPCIFPLFLDHPWPVHAFILNQCRLLRMKWKTSYIPCHSRARTCHSFVYQEFGKFLPISCQDATSMQQVTTLNIYALHTERHTPDILGWLWYSVWCTDRTACSHTMMHDAVEVTAILHYCSLLVVASSMDNNASNYITLPPCKFFLAPSTIPGSACMRT